MPVTYNSSLKNTRMQAVADAIDSGGAGTLEIGTTGMAAVLSTHTLSSPCGTVADGVLTFDAIQDALGEGDGTAAEARIKSGAGDTVLSGLNVGTGSNDIVLDTAIVSTGNTVSITSGAITHA